MDKNYYKKFEPIFGSWYIKEILGEGSFGEVFRIEKIELGVSYSAALKIITVPKSVSEIKSIMADGMSEEEVTSYYIDVVEDIVSESVLMAKLKGVSNIVSYEDHRIIKHEGDIGWDILIMMELLTPLNDYASKHLLSTHDVIKLGIDICKALEVCESNRIIHRDIKPENIFISPNGDFKLGDFGIARTIEKTIGGMSRKGTYSYMAPEIYKGKMYGASVDTYSLGIVLYRFLNSNRVPFMPLPPEPITYQARETAFLERLKGTAIPKPSNADEAVSDVILKACAYYPGRRYPSAKALRDDLEMLLVKTRDLPINTSNKDNPKGATEIIGIKPMQKVRRMIIGIIIVLLACAGTLGIIISSNDSDSNSDLWDVLLGGKNYPASLNFEKVGTKNNPASSTAQINKTLDEAVDGETIYIASGEYFFENSLLEIFQANNITIKGVGETKPQFNCEIYLQIPNIKIENIDVKNSNGYTGIMVSEGSAIISNVNIEMRITSSNELCGIRIAPEATATIENCAISVKHTYEYDDDLSEGAKNAIRTAGSVAISAGGQFALTNSQLEADTTGIEFDEHNILSDSKIKEIIQQNEVIASTQIAYIP